VRELINADLAPQEQYNGLHATDTTDQAWRFIRLVAPSQEGVPRAKIDELRRTIPAASSVEAAMEQASEAVP
jgi:hypothetical protein